MPEENVTQIMLSPEQSLFIGKALMGDNILVDACIGSGKTTAIERLCCEWPKEQHVLYLTYNRLLKLDAKRKIRNAPNITVNNYHGFAWMALKQAGISCGTSDLIETFNRVEPTIDAYDLLVLDEYQDIDQELSDMLRYIKSVNPQMQIVAVGDMAQKIYDKTTLDVPAFIDEFLGEHTCLAFTQCFRLPQEHAAMLGRIWGKSIVGVNSDCCVEEMHFDDAIDFLMQQEPKDILCLGRRLGPLSAALNELESRCPERFNKKTVYASIRDDDGSAVSPREDAAIFTTFDSSKGLERPICVVFDYTEDNWEFRVKEPLTSGKILRNIFCVAASRGKRHIIFVDNGRPLLSEKTLCTVASQPVPLEDVNISEMFRFRYREDLEACFALLVTRPVRLSRDDHVISIRSNDELIDLSPCIGMYQEAAFFGQRTIDAQLMQRAQFHPNEAKALQSFVQKASLDEKVLELTARETSQARYRAQVAAPFVTPSERQELWERLGTYFSPDEKVQISCQIDFAEASGGPLAFSAYGAADVVRDTTVYELKFVSELMHEHFLQCACYMVAMNLPKGILWNTRDNSAYQITVPDRKAFLNAVARAVTKRRVAAYYHPSAKSMKKGKTTAETDAPIFIPDTPPAADVIAVIDTETNDNDAVMSIGIVIADAKTFQPLERQYYIIPEAAAIGGMYSYVLEAPEAGTPIRCSRSETMQKIVVFLRQYDFPRIFAYNAKFDRNHLPELSALAWCDIMRLAAYRQFNPTIPAGEPLYRTGRLKRGFGVEPTLRRLRGDSRYLETHNALCDALDELEIMRRLNHPLSTYLQNAALDGTCKSLPAAASSDEASSPAADHEPQPAEPDACLQELTDKLRELSSLAESSAEKSESSASLKGYPEAHAVFEQAKLMQEKLQMLAVNQPTVNPAITALADYRRDELDRRLSRIPVAEMQRLRPGLRVAALSKAGFRTMQQVYGRSYNQLVSIGGIGNKTAEDILVASRLITEQERGKISYKPRRTRTMAGEKLVHAYCKFLWLTRIHQQIDDLLSAETDWLEKEITAAKPLSSKLRWLLPFSNSKKQEALQAASALEQRLASKTEPLYRLAAGLCIKGDEIPAKAAWSEYLQMPQVYEDWFVERSKTMGTF